MEGGRALCLALVVSAIVLVSFNGEAAAMAGDAQPATSGAGPDTNVLCVSKCGTCPTVCTSPPPPSPKDGGSSTSPPGQSKGGRPSNYYYLFTGGGSRTSGAGAGLYAVAFLVVVSLVANFQ